jgi:hypothetical protein
VFCLVRQFDLAVLLDLRIGGPSQLVSGSLFLGEQEREMPGYAEAPFGRSLKVVVLAILKGRDLPYAGSVEHALDSFLLR